MSNTTANQTSWSTAIISLVIFFALCVVVINIFTPSEADIAKKQEYNQCLRKKENMLAARINAQYNGHGNSELAVATYLNSICKKHI